MLTTKASAQNQVCLLVLANSRECPSMTCASESCSAWRWQGDETGADGGNRLGYCGLVGRIDFPDRYLKGKKKEALRVRPA